ncbi:MAG TPA: RNA-binding protein [Puia sp.]|nr:RNA-binding protein [Puia sp.]
MKIFVGGLPFDMDDQEFKEIFEDYGTVSSAKVIQDRDTGKSRGFGFVEYIEKSSAENAIARLNGGELEGRKLTVNVAAERKPKENNGGRNFRNDEPNYRRN